MHQTPTDFFLFLVVAVGVKDYRGDVWFCSVLSILLILDLLIFQGDCAQNCDCVSSK